jgi:hypothetical protein
MSGGVNPVFTIEVTEEPAAAVKHNKVNIIWDNPFIDVSVDDWFYEDVAYAYKNGLFKGTTDTAFDPDGTMTRAMLVTVLYRYAGSPDVGDYINPFGDLETGAGGVGEYYTGPVLWAAANGIVFGDAAGNFNPDAPIKRQEFAAILVRYAGHIGDVHAAPAVYAHFEDADEIDEYAAGAIQTLYNLGVIRGVGGGFIVPLDGATRAQVAAMLHRYAELP